MKKFRQSVFRFICLPYGYAQQNPKEEPITFYSVVVVVARLEALSSFRARSISSSATMSAAVRNVGL